MRSGSPYRQALGRRDFVRLGGGAALAAGGIGGLVGCSGNSGDGLEFMYWGSTFEKKAISDMLGKFDEAHEKIEVSARYTPLIDYSTKVSTLVASNTPPDIAYLSNDQFWQMAERGKLVNLLPHIEKHQALQGRIPSSYFWLDERTLVGSQLAQGTQVLWYNKDLFSAAGVEAPPADAASAWTWDEYVEAAERLTLDENGKRPSESGFDPDSIRQFGTNAPVGAGFMWALLASNGAGLIDESGTKYTLDRPEAVEVVQKLQDLIHKHHVAPTPAQLGKNAPTTTVQLQTKRIAMIVDGDWTLLDLGQSGMNYGCGVLPRLQEPFTLTGGAVGAVFEHDDKRTEQAMELYAYYNDPQHVDLFAKGLWMPLQEKYYTDREFIAQWTSSEIYPAGFKTAVIDPTLEHSVTGWWQYTKNSAKITNVLTTAWEQIARGKKSAQEVLTAIKPTVEKELRGRYETFEI